MSDVMVISPHPDDAEICMGGTIIKMVKAGLKIIIVDLTTGEPTPYGNVEKRIREATRASKILGIKERINLKLPNRRLKDSIENRVLLANQIRKFKPNIIFAPHGSDIHPDHIETTKISQAARFYAKLSKAEYMSLKWRPYFPNKIYYYYSFHQLRHVKASFIVDISKNFYDKMKAVKAYKSQFILNKKNKALLPVIKTYSRYFGSLIHSQYGEPFFSPTVVKISKVEQLID